MYLVPSVHCRLEASPREKLGFLAAYPYDQTGSFVNEVIS
jgi:hypothetical protein